jgi:uncharacterized damage-inducible protein DinB
VLGKTGYIRQRDNEFTSKNIPREEIIKGIDEAIAVLQATLPSLKEEDLGKTFPIEFLGKNVTVLDILIHLYGHLNYHLGQINYHRRMIS